MTEVVVTGASGFIGSALCARLEASGTRALRWRRGEPPPRAAGAACVHLAADNDAAAVAARPEESRREAAALAREVLAAGYRRVVFASSARVYGDAATTPRTEDSPLAGNDPYALVKRETEALFAGGTHVVARLTNVYGPGMSRANVLSRVVAQLQAGGDVRLRETASVRDYLHVSDAAEALAALALGSAAGTFNVSTGAGVSVADLASAAARVFGRPDARVVADDPAAAPTYLVLDPSRLAAAAGWRARTTLEQGLGTLKSCAERNA